MAEQYYEGIGRRKESVARVRVMSGSGSFMINGKPLDERFPRYGDIEAIMRVFETINEGKNSYDVSVLVKGGGVTGQRDAIVLGLARAFLKMNPDLKPVLRKGGFLTRDARIKERKKPGLKRARKAPTYTKR